MSKLRTAGMRTGGSMLLAVLVAAALVTAGCQTVDAERQDASGRLGSSENTGKTDAAEGPADTGAGAEQTGERRADSERQPSLHAEQMVSLHTGVRSVFVWANTDIRQDTVEPAIRDSLAVSKEMESFHYSVEWISPRVFRLFYWAPESETFSFAFRLDDVETMDGRTFRNDERPEQNIVTVLHKAAGMPSVSVMDPAAGETKVIQARESQWVKAVRRGEKGGVNALLFHGKEKHGLLDLETGEWLDIPLIRDGKKGYGNEYGFVELFSDRWYDEHAYVVLGNKRLYRIDLRTFRLQLLREFDRPVYGMSSSPDGRQIAVLLAHDESIGPDADLTVLSEQGKTLLEAEKAAFISHSDGFLFVYPMHWQDASTLVLPMSGKDGLPPGHQVLLDVRSGETRPLEPQAVPEETLETFLPAGSVWHETHWSPDGTRVAVRTEQGQIWLVETDGPGGPHARFAGAGKVLGWQEGGTLVWLNADPWERVYTF